MSIMSLASNTITRRGLKSFAPAPTITGGSAFYAGFGNPTFTVSNNSSYVQPTYSATVYNASTGAVTTANSAITKSGASLTFTLPGVGSYVLQVKAQDFGGLVSAVTSFEFAVSTFVFPSSTYRYWRLNNFAGPPPGGSGLYTDYIRFYTGTGQTGTIHPTSAMSSNTAPAPYVVSARYNGFGGYEAWKAFNGGAYWTLSSPNTPVNEWLQLDLGSAITIQSMRIVGGNASHGFTGFSLYGSDAGTFTGEEVLIFTIGSLSAGGTFNLG